MMMKAKEAEAGAVVTRVWWDINRCPVPDDVDVRRVGPCIKRALEKLGYSGPLSITAIGILTDVRHDFLREVHSCGIGIHHVPTDIFGRAVLLWTWSNQPPANLMLISAEAVFSKTLDMLSMHGYNIVRSIFPDDPASALTYPRSFLWESLLPSLRADAMDSGALLEEKCSETGEPALHCSTCGVPVQGFENFTTHLKSREHADESQYYHNEDEVKKEKMEEEEEEEEEEEKEKEEEEEEEKEKEKEAEEEEVEMEMEMEMEMERKRKRKRNSSKT